MPPELSLPNGGVGVGGIKSGIDNSDALAATASKNQSNKQRGNPPKQKDSKRKKKKRKKKKKAVNRYFWFLCVCAFCYVVLIYHSVELADKIWNAELSLHEESQRPLEDQTPLEQLQNMNAQARAASHGKLPNGELRKKSHPKNAERKNLGVEEIFDRLAEMVSPNKESRHRKSRRKQVRHPTLVPKYVAPETLKLPKPIINVGFPKAGTSTIFSFFYCNGLKAQHWYCCEEQKHPGHAKIMKLMSACMLKNMANDRPIFEDCGDYDVYTEINGPRHFGESQDLTMLDDGSLANRSESTTAKRRLFFPQHHHLDKIHQQYPNATLILNKRDTEAWIKSVLAWDPNLQFQILNEFFAQNKTRFLFENSTENESLVEQTEGRILRNATLSNNETRSRNATLSNNETRSNNAALSNNETRFNNETLVVQDESTNNKKKRRRRNRFPFGNSDNRRRLLKSVYHYHMEFVRDWVSRHPSHALVEVSIADEDAGEKLANAFGLKEECWGHFNQKKKVNSKKDKAAKHAKEMAAAALKQQASGRESDAGTKPKTLQKD